MIAAPSAKAVPAQDYCEATVPNTFDLAERADLIINAMTSVIKTDLDGEFIWCIHISPLKNVNYAPAKKVIRYVSLRLADW